VTAGYDQVADLFGEDFIVVHQRRREADGIGASLASRWPIRDVIEMDLFVTDRIDPMSFVASMLAGWVEVPPPIGPVLLASPVPSFRLGEERERELQAVAASSRLEMLAADGGHVVVAGDFSAGPDTNALRFWTGLGSLEGRSVSYRDAWSTIHPEQTGITFSPDNPLVTEGNWPLELGRRMDYILVRCDAHGPTLRIADCRQVLDAPVGGVWASDHFGVLADLAVR
jgi:endonuclease/exonuclease/phosphatase family metal-dependent hydrolase